MYDKRLNQRCSQNVHFMSSYFPVSAFTSPFFMLKTITSHFWNLDFDFEISRMSKISGNYDSSVKPLPSWWNGCIELISLEELKNKPVIIKQSHFLEIEKKFLVTKLQLQVRTWFMAMAQPPQYQVPRRGAVQPNTNTPMHSGSISRVYADVCVKRPDSYSNYETMTVSWG